MWDFLATTQESLIRTIQRKDRVLYAVPPVKHDHLIKPLKRAFRPYRKDHG